MQRNTDIDTVFPLLELPLDIMLMLTQNFSLQDFCALISVHSYLYQQLFNYVFSQQFFPITAAPATRKALACIWTNDLQGLQELIAPRAILQLDGHDAASDDHSTFNYNDLFEIYLSETNHFLSFGLLHFARRLGRQQILDLIYDKFAAKIFNVDAYDQLSNTKLMLALQCQQACSAELVPATELLHNNVYEHTALYVAIQVKNAEVTYLITRHMLQNFNHATTNCFRTINDQDKINVDTFIVLDEAIINADVDAQDNVVIFDEGKTNLDVNAQASVVIIEEAWGLAIKQNFIAGLTAILAAFQDRQQSLTAEIDYLISKGLEMAAQDDNTATLRYLICKLTTKKLQDNKQLAKSVGKALISAAQHTNNMIAMPLLDLLPYASVCLDKTDSNWKTAFSYAYINNNLELITQLIQHGLAIDAERHARYLILAMKDNKFEIFKALLTSPLLQVNKHLGAGVSDFVPTRDDATLLFWAVSLNKVEFVNLLLNSGANAAILSKSGLGAIHIAAQHGYLPSLELLLKAEPKLVNQLCQAEQYKGYTPAHFASLNNNLDSLKLLLQHGADLSSMSASIANDYFMENQGYIHLKIKQDRQVSFEFSNKNSKFTLASRDWTAIEFLKTDGTILRLKNTGWTDFDLSKLQWHSLTITYLGAGCLDLALINRNMEVVNWLLQQPAIKVTGVTWERLKEIDPFQHFKLFCLVYLKWKMQRAQQQITQPLSSDKFFAININKLEKNLHLMQAVFNDLIAEPQPLAVQNVSVEKYIKQRLAEKLAQQPEVASLKKLKM